MTNQVNNFSFWGAGPGKVNPASTLTTGRGRDAHDPVLLVWVKART